MRLLTFRNKLQQTGFYIPFTFYFLVFVLCATVAYKILTGNLVHNETAFVDIFLLLLKVAVWFGAIVIAFSFATVLISFVHFLIKERKGITFDIKTDLEESRLHQKQGVHIILKPVLKPFFGFIKIRLEYDKDRFTRKFSLIEQGRKTFFNNKIEGVYHWRLPEIKEYHIGKAIIYFEDVFQFFSIAVDVPVNNQFFTQPPAKNITDVKVRPRKTEENVMRIDELRKVEGEYLNYKNFENNDDVRRIVWKIYAKNKELVVRMPEILDPYTSHIYLYASFYSTFNFKGNKILEIPFLNYYKVMTWAIYENMVKRGFEVRFVPDQEVAKKNFSTEKQWVKYNISTSRWHAEKDLLTYSRTSDAGVIIISSLSNVQQVKELVERYSNTIKFVFIKLTDSLKEQKVLDWVQWLFVKNEDNDIDGYRRSWALSGIRLKIMENEAMLEELLKKHEVELVR